MVGPAQPFFPWVVAMRRRIYRYLLALAIVALAFLAWLSGGRDVYVKDDAEALARVIRSEVGQSPLSYRVHVAWATRNLAAQRHQSNARMVCSPCGPQEGGRQVSSRQPGTELDRQLARNVLAAPAMLDPTGGATQFIDPALQDQLASRAATGYHGRPYWRVRRQWSRGYGWEPSYRLAPDLELWGPKRARRSI